MDTSYNVLLKQWVTRCPNLPYFKVQAYTGLFLLRHAYSGLTILMMSIAFLFYVIGIGTMILWTFWGIYFLIVAIFPTILAIQLRKTRSSNCKINLIREFLQIDENQIKFEDIIEINLITWIYRRWSKAKRRPKIFAHPVYGLELSYRNSNSKLSSNKSIHKLIIFNCFSTELEYWRKLGEYFQFILESATDRKIPFISDPQSRIISNNQSFIIEDLGRVVLFPAKDI